MKCRPQTHKSGSTGWQAVASWEVNEEAMTFAPATFEIQTLQGGCSLTSHIALLQPVQDYTLAKNWADCDSTCQEYK